jgi:RNA polymerase sigma factor (sigma-70 family)
LRIVEIGVVRGADRGVSGGMERMTSDGFSHELTQDDRWLRGLARRVVGDAHLAEDVAQETWLRAARHGVFGRGWLATVLRHVSIQSARGAERRTRRERAVAEPTPQAPDVAETAAQLSARSALVDAVLALEPALRDVVLLRFYEDRSFDEVARALGIPSSTAKSREKRALELLRQRLEREVRGDGRSCLALLIPYAHAESALAAVGGLAVSGSVKVAVSAAVLALVAVVVWVQRDEGPSNALRSAASDVAVQEATADPEITPSEAPARELVAADANVVAADVAQEPAAHATQLRGRVVDMRGLALGNVEVAFAPTDVVDATTTTARSLSDGTFALVATAAQGSISCVEPGTITVMTAEFTIEHAGDALVVVAERARPLRGSVVTPGGDAIADAQVRVVLPFQFESSIPFSLERSQRAAFVASTGADGTFAFTAIPALDDVVVAAGAAGHAHAVAHADRDPSIPLRIELAPITSRDEMMMGQVVDSQGIPVEGATVGAGELARTTDARGIFGLPMDGLAAAEAHGEVVVRAGKRGHTCATLAKPTDGWPRHVTLVLGPAPTSIRGIVRDASGVALAGVTVALADPTVVGIDGYAPVYDEALASGADVRTVTAEDGSFVLDGLSARTYALVAWSETTLEIVRSAPIPAGNRDVVLEFATRADAFALTGRVETPDGKPIDGANIAISRDLGSVRYLNYGFGLAAMGAQATANADGTFRFDTIAPGPLAITVSAADCESKRLDLAEVRQQSGPLVVVLERQCAFRVETARVSRGSIQFRGADDRTRMILSRRADQTISLGQSPLVDGKTPVLSVAEGATTLCVLDENQVEVLRVPVAFVPGEITVLRP